MCLALELCNWLHSLLFFFIFYTAPNPSLKRPRVLTMKAQLSKSWRTPLALAAVGLSLVLGTAAADPDFGNIDDLLAGQRHLLRTDDLIVTAPGQSGVPLQNVILDSSDSQISAEKTLRFRAPRQTGSPRVWAVSSTCPMTSSSP